MDCLLGALIFSPTFMVKIRLQDHKTLAKLKFLLAKLLEEHPTNRNFKMRRASAAYRMKFLVMKFLEGPTASKNLTVRGAIAAYRMEL